jgi:hypothetical protein
MSDSADAVLNLAAETVILNDAARNEIERLDQKLTDLKKVTSIILQDIESIIRSIDPKSPNRNLRDIRTTLITNVIRARSHGLTSSGG